MAGRGLAARCAPLRPTYRDADFDYYSRMRVSELSARAGVPLPTIKFYIREGLLPPGETTAKNQAEYGDAHLARLALIRALREQAGLPVATIANALRAADGAADHDFPGAAIDAVVRPQTGELHEDAELVAKYKAGLISHAQERGWRVEERDQSLDDAARALTAACGVFPSLEKADLTPYLEVSERLAGHEIPDDWEPTREREQALHYALLGTVLFEPVLLALRRLAHLSRTRLLQAAREHKPGRTGTDSQERTAEIYRVVRAIPRGKVATYGQIAELAGAPSGHRIVARAMKSCPESLAWQRVVGKKDARRASVAIDDPEHARLQRMLLEREGVKFDHNGFISLRAHGWLPVDPASRRR